MASLDLSDPKPDPPETKSTIAAPSVVKKPAGSIRRPSSASRPSISGLQSTTTLPKPPMRVLVPPSKRPSSNTTAQRTNVVRPPARQSSTTGNLPKPAVVMPKAVGKSTDGPRRVLVQASDKPASRMVSTSTIPASKTQGPQRVLIQTTTNPVKRPLGLSSSINPPAPTSRLPGPSRIAVPSTSKTMRTSGISKPVGRWV